MWGEERRTDAELLAMTRDEPEAFATFYRRYERPVLGYLFARVREPELAADLAAEVFASALEAADAFDVERAGSDTAAAWLFTIAHNTLSTSLRRGQVAETARRRLGMREPLALDDLDLERIVELGDPSSLADLLEELPANERKAILARVLEERDYAELATDLGCSALVARKRVSRGLKRLRNALQAAGQEQ
jgi:RNA polymerase sigma-70 factor (ECF subfamily)